MGILKPRDDSAIRDPLTVLKPNVAVTPSPAGNDDALFRSVISGWRGDGQHIAVVPRQRFTQRPASNRVAPAQRSLLHIAQVLLEVRIPS